jgi:lipoprotein NlpD
MKMSDRIAMLVPMRAIPRAFPFRLLLLAALALLSACSTPTFRRSVVVETRADGTPVHASGTLHADTYVVARGDTLYSIAFRVGQDFRDLARWNGIKSPYTISPGQRLRVVPPRHRAASRRVVRSKPVPRPTVPKPPTRSTVAVAAGAASGAGAARHTSGTAREVAGVHWQWPVPGAVLKGYNARDAIPGVLLAGHAGDPVRAAADGTVVYSGNGLVGYGELIIIKHSDAYLSAYGHNSKRLVHEGEHVKAGQVIAQMGSSGAPRVELEFQIRRNGKPVDPLHFLPSR